MDILLNITGASIGRCTIVPDDFKEANVSQHVTIIRCINPEIRRFIHFLLISPYGQSMIWSRQVGMSREGLSKKVLEQFQISLPPLAEQRRIVAKIDELMARCDELERLKVERDHKQITVHKAALNRLLTAKDHSDFQTSWHFITQHFGELYSVKENLAELRKAILQLAVMGKLVPQDKSDRPASELLKEIEKEKIRLVTEKKLKIGQLTSDTKRISENIIIPSSWVWVKGVDLFFITKLAGFEYTEHINLLDDGEVPVIRAQNVKPFRLDLNNLKYIDLKTSKLLERCALTKESLLVTFIGAGIGDVALFDFQERWHLAPNVAKMEPFLDCENKVNLKYIACFLNSPLGRDEIFKHLKSTAQPSISMGTIRDIDYPLPPLAEQHRIVAKIDRLMTLCDELEKQIDAAESKQTNLLNSLMASIAKSTPVKVTLELLSGKEPKGR